MKLSRGNSRQVNKAREREEGKVEIITSYNCCPPKINTDVYQSVLLKL